MPVSSLAHGQVALIEKWSYYGLLVECFGTYKQCIASIAEINTKSLYNYVPLCYEYSYKALL